MTSGSVRDKLSFVTETGKLRVPTQARARKTRARLVDAAQKEFSEQGYATTTAKSIAKCAGVSVGSFYQYFPDKDAVLRELHIARFETIARRVLGILQETKPEGDAESLRRMARERMREVVHAVADYHREDPGLHQVLTERRHHDEELDRLTTRGEQILVQRLASLLHVWNHPGDADATAFVIFGMVEGAVHAHVLGESHVTDDRFYDALVECLLRLTLPDLA